MEAAAVQAPRFEVDPLWPKPLPNHWVIGAVIGVTVDANDHIWIIHREGSLEAKEKYLASKPPAAECCAPAPPILEFNEAGDLIGSWGGPGEGFDWPASNHGIDVDYKGNVWIGGNGRGSQPAPLPSDESRMAGAGPVHDSMVLGMLGSGSLFGEMGVLDGKPRSATVTAITDMDIAVLDRPALARLIETVPGVACALMGAIMARVAERLRATNIKLNTLTALNLSLQDELAALRANKPPPDVAL